MATTVKSGRWFMAIMATVLMICLGTVYAWSYFQTPIMKAFGWDNTQVSLIFSFTILFLGIASSIGGIWLPKIGPKKMAVSGSVLFAAGYAIASLALTIKSLPLLYIGYGLIGGTGLGLGYVTPVATIAKWFPDKKGFATGLVVMGFGFGALVMSKILAPTLLAWTGGSLPAVFLSLAGIFLVLTFGSSLTLKNPPPGWIPGYQRTNAKNTGSSKKKQAAQAAPPLSPGQAFREAKGDLASPKFILLWIMFLCNIAAGIAIVSFQSPMFQTLWKKNNSNLTTADLAGLGATLIAVTSLFNGFGRFIWGAVSDKVGRIQTFRIMLGSELVIFAALILTGNPWIFAILLCWILSCYGGGFGTMPSTVSELFGAAKMTVLYGAILTAWAIGGVVGPQITAYISDKHPGNASTLSFIVGGVFIAVGFGISLFIPTAPREKVQKAKA